MARVYTAPPPMNKPRPVRSYVLREGRLTKGQQRALNELLPRYRITPPPAGAVIHPREIFPQDAPTHLEIGFGDGGALLEYAQKTPTENFIGAEVHRPGIGRLLLQLQARQLGNVRVFHGDGIELLSAVASNALTSIHLYFPDPWPKKKHHKRRIIQPEVVALIAEKLTPNGRFHFATDWQPYAEQTLQLLEQSPRLKNQSTPNKFPPRPTNRPTTKFETRGKNLGHEVWDVVMEKVG